jgi:hypothetical protein
LIVTVIFLVPLPPALPSLPSSAPIPSFCSDPDEYTTRLRELADDWVHAHVMTEQMIAEHIRKEEIDIAVDLAGSQASL